MVSHAQFPGVPRVERQEESPHSLQRDHGPVDTTFEFLSCRTEKMHPGGGFFRWLMNEFVCCYFGCNASGVGAGQDKKQACSPFTTEEAKAEG